MVVPADAFFITHRKQLIELAINNKIVSIFAQREYALAGVSWPRFLWTPHCSMEPRRKEAHE